MEVQRSLKRKYHSRCPSTPPCAFRCGVTELTWAQSHWGGCNLYIYIFTTVCYRCIMSYGQMNRNEMSNQGVLQLLDSTVYVSFWPKVWYMFQRIEKVKSELARSSNARHPFTLSSITSIGFLSQHCPTSWASVLVTWRKEQTKWKCLSIQCFPSRYPREYCFVLGFPGLVSLVLVLWVSLVWRRSYNIGGIILTKTFR